MKTLLEFDYKKATQVINYLAKKEGGSIDKLKLIKLIYLADRFHLRRYGRPMINDAYFAMPLGPVGSSVKDIVDSTVFLADQEKQYAQSYIRQGSQANSVQSVNEVQEDLFSQSELDALNFSYNQFGKYPASKLVNITHRYPEWRKFKGAFDSKETTREPMTYSDFFNDPINNGEDKFALGKDILDASKEIFTENYQVAQYWL
ncbi:MAG: Panacea domain-containing protein [Patescibacteria group bacterium]|nr:Panacea domain-containing protein [Patescibacteria group bacterium]